MPISSIERLPHEVGQIGWGNQALWDKPENARFDNGEYAQVELPYSDGNVPFPHSTLLAARDFRFNTIPNNATIRGIRVTVRALASSSKRVISSVIRLTKAGTVGKDYGDGSIFWPSANDTDLVYGGAIDKWKACWTDEEIRNSNFGVVLQVSNYGGNPVTAMVDFIRIRVWYETPPGP